METIKEEIGFDGRKKIYVQYTEQEMAQMKNDAKKKSKKRQFRKPYINKDFLSIFKKKS